MKNIRLVVVICSVLSIIWTIAGSTESYVGEWEIVWQEDDIWWLEDIHFTNMLEGAALGMSDGDFEKIVIISTNSGGASWDVFYTGMNGPGLFRLKSIHNGWIAARTGTPNSPEAYLRSPDGQEWRPFPARPEDWGLLTEWHTEIADLHFPDARCGWVIGWWGIHGMGTSYISYTEDGGDTWTDQWRKENTGTVYLSDIHFVNADVGWAAGDTILHTVDGGKTWTEQRLEGIPVGWELRSVFAIDDLRAWALGYSSELVPWEGTSIIFHTIDGGSEWVRQAEMEIGGNDLVLTNEEEGWVVGNNGLILHTTNSGFDWEAQKSGVEYNLKGITYDGANNLWVVGEGGAILKYSLSVPAQVNPVNKRLDKWGAIKEGG